MLKEKIKACLPDCYIYIYKTCELIPAYIKSIVKYDSIIQSPSFFSNEETVNMIVDRHMSLSRFGDGEFGWMAGEHLASFQQYSDELAYRLKQSLNTDNENVLVGIPKGLFDSSECRIYARMWWRIIRENSLRKMTRFIKWERKFADASITRPWIDYCNENRADSEFSNLKRIWKERDICIVEGRETKLGMGNDLFNDARSIKRIECPPKNCFEKIDEIEDIIRAMVPQDTTILAALGPTASILADDLSKEGYQVIDIGHVDIEYMWYKQGCIIRKPVDGKYVNEVGGGLVNDKYDNMQSFQATVIAEIE